MAVEGQQGLGDGNEFGVKSLPKAPPAPRGRGPVPGDPARAGPGPLPCLHPPGSHSCPQQGKVQLNNIVWGAPRSASPSMDQVLLLAPMKYLFGAN